jgi:hypothetical protein
MKIERLRELKNARPFVPFRIFRSGGDPVEVTNADWLCISPKESWVMVSLPNDGSLRLATDEIVRTEVIGFPAPEDLEFL